MKGPIRQDGNLYTPQQWPGAPPLKSGGGGGTSDGMDGSEAKRLDEKIDGNFKWVVGVYGAGFILLVSAFAAGFLVLQSETRAGFDRVSAKLDVVVEKQSTTNERLARVETKLEEVKPPRR